MLISVQPDLTAARPVTTNGGKAACILTMLTPMSAFKHVEQGRGLQMHVSTCKQVHNSAFHAIQEPSLYAMQ